VSAAAAKVATASVDPASALTESRPAVVLAFLPAGSDAAAESELASVPALSTGIMSATQGNYVTAQMLLDITQGARVSYSAYTPPLPPRLALVLSARSTEQPRGALVLSARPSEQLRGTPARASAPATVASWPQVLKRAARAPQLLQPGLLTAQIPGGGAYAGLTGQSDEDGAIAAGRTGHVATVSLGSAATLPARIAGLRERHGLVVADLPAGQAGAAQLRLLSASRSPEELLLVVQRPPDGSVHHELLWVAVGGYGGGRTLTSTTTEERGLIAAIDLAPTILRHLGLSVPTAMRGQPVRTDGAFDGTYLRALKSRLVVVYPRRLPALAFLLAAWAGLLLLAGLPFDGGDPHARRARQAWAQRVGALALLWTPVAEFLPAAMEPSRAVEYAVLAATCFLLGALTDRLLPWPRAPLAPALAAVVALSADALLGTQLLMRSLLGPDPSFGARFYGIGNELKSGLAVLVFAAVAAASYPAVRGRRAAVIMALAGIALAVVEGSARIGAGVGGVILVSAGTAVATAVLLPGRLTRRRALTVLISPVVGLVALAALDLATAHGAGHFTGSVLHARSAGDVRDIVVRRYAAAYEELKHGAMPVASALALIAAAVGVRRREHLLIPVAGDPTWLAALAGGLTAGVIGALTEDSGPVLLVVAVFALGCVLGYLWGAPAERSITPPRTPDRSRAARSRARTRPPGALSR
jgi:hypothetical protein